MKNDSQKVFNIVEPVNLMTLERRYFEIIGLLSQNLESLIDKSDVADSNLTMVCACPVN